MAQPSGQLALASGHSTEYFWYAQGTGIWDAKNGVMLTKTGTAGMTTEGGVNVAVGDAATTYALQAAINQASPWTYRVRCHVDAAAGTNAMVSGDDTGTANYTWLRQDAGTVIQKINGIGAGKSATVTAMKTWTFVFSGGTLTTYDGDTSLGTESITSANLRINKLLGGYSGGSFKFKGTFEFAHMIPAAITAGDVATLNADPYAVLDAGGGTPTLAVSDGAHAHSTDGVTLSTLGTLTVADATHGHTTDGITLTATTNGVITIPAVRDWGTGALKTGETGVQVDIRNITTGALVVRKSGQTTHATTGVCVVSDAVIVAGTTYEVVTRFADGSKGMWDYAAA